MQGNASTNESLKLVIDVFYRELERVKRSNKI